MKTYFLSILLLFSYHSFFCQETSDLKLNSTPTVFYSKVENAFYAFSDTTVIYEYKLSTKTWTKHNFNTNGFGERLSLFTPMNSDKGDYMVAKGCGIVLKIIDNKLVRIDHSFDHQNQHCSQRFTIGDTLFFYGGYGLFTRKNILTYFTEENAEWLLYPKEKYEDYYLENGKTWKRGFEIWSYGNSVFKDAVISQGIKSRCIFRLSKDKIFKQEYEMPPKINVWGNDGFFFLDEGIPYLFDPKRGELIRVKHPWRSTILDCIMDRSNSYVLQIFGPETQIPNWVVKIEKITLDYSKTIPLKKVELQADQQPTRISLLLVISCFVLFSLGVFYYLLQKRKKKKLLFHFSHYEEVLFAILAKGEWIENQELIAAVSKDDNSFEANKKRKDLQMQSLLDKLMKTTGLSEEEIIEKRKDDADRRITLIRFKMSFLKLIDN